MTSTKSRLKIDMSLDPKSIGHHSQSDTNGIANPIFYIAGTVRNKKLMNFVCRSIEETEENSSNEESVLQERKVGFLKSPKCENGKEKIFGRMSVIIFNLDTKSLIGPLKA